MRVQQRLMRLLQLSHVLGGHPVEEEVDLGLIGEALHSPFPRCHWVGHQAVVDAARVRATEQDRGHQGLTLLEDAVPDLLHLHL
jgi:hypothetical protein